MSTVSVTVEMRPHHVEVMYAIGNLGEILGDHRVTPDTVLGYLAARSTEDGIRMPTRIGVLKQWLSWMERAGWIERRGDCLIPTQTGIACAMAAAS